MIIMKAKTFKAILFDADSGVRSANKVGLFCIGIKNATNTLDQLKEMQLVISNFNELQYSFNDSLELTYE